MRAFITSCISGIVLLGIAGCDGVERTAGPPDRWQVPLAAVTNAASFCGRVVYLEFWGSWCVPCTRSLPAADQLRAALRRQDFDVLGINLDGDPAEADAFLREHPVSFPMASDPSRETLAHFGIRGVPTAILMDRNGEIRHRIEGYTDSAAERIRDWVFELVREPARGGCSERTG